MAVTIKLLAWTNTQTPNTIHRTHMPANIFYSFIIGHERNFNYNDCGRVGVVAAALVAAADDDDDDDNDGL